MHRSLLLWKTLTGFGTVGQQWGKEFTMEFILAAFYNKIRWY